MQWRRTVVLGLAALGLGAACGRVATDPEAARALQDGGHVIFFRHAATAWQGSDDHRWPRARQRLLSERGEEDARQIGERFRALGIPVGEVRASPFARCIDTAELAFGRHIAEPRLLPPEMLGAPRGRGAWLRAEMARPRRGQPNLVLVGHSSNMMAVRGPALLEGEAALVRATGAAGWAVVGRMGVRDW